MDSLTLLEVVERVGVLFATVIIFSMIASRFLTYLANQQKADLAERQTWDKIRKDDNQQWLSLVTGLKMAIEAQGMTAGEHYKAVSQDRINSVAYQNTTTNALSELLAINKELRVVPEGVREANKTLGIIQKSQHGLTENEARRELEFKSELARMNNVMLGIQTSMTKLEKAFENLPMAMQKAIAPTLNPIVEGIDELLRTARDTSQKIDDLPLANDNSRVEIGLSEAVIVSDSHNETPKNGV